MAGAVLMGQGTTQPTRPGQPDTTQPTRPGQPDTTRPGMMGMGTDYFVSSESTVYLWRREGDTLRSVGTFNATRASFEQLSKSGSGLVLNISATLHYHGTPLQIHASAAKAGVDAITRNLAVEWGRFGVRSCGIAPGPIGDTEGMKRLAPGDIADKAKQGIPAGRFGTIDEIAAAAVYLRSPAAAYVTGHVLVVDGGNILQERKA